MRPDSNPINTPKFNPVSVTICQYEPQATGQDYATVTTKRMAKQATDLLAVRTAVQEAGLDYESADVEFVASMEIPVADVETAAKVMRLVDVIDDLDVVQNVFSYAQISDEILEQLDEE